MSQMVTNDHNCDRHNAVLGVVSLFKNSTTNKMNDVCFAAVFIFCDRQVNRGSINRRIDSLQDRER
jgi:hypothetical protein